jgi:hypothetical protein
LFALEEATNNIIPRRKYTMAGWNEEVSCSERMKFLLHTEKNSSGSEEKQQ